MIDVDQLRAIARETINNTLAHELERDPSLADDLNTLFHRVSKAYPFENRKPVYLEVWLAEIAETRATLKKGERRYSEPLARACPACLAKSWQPCISVNENDNLAPEFLDASNQAPLLRGNKAPGRIPSPLKRAVMHRVRIDPTAPLHEVVSAA